MIIFQREKLCITEKIRVNLKKTQHFVTIEGSLNCSISNHFYVSLGSSLYLYTCTYTLFIRIRIIVIIFNQKKIDVLF